MSDQPEHTDTDALLSRWLTNPIFAAAGETRCRELAASCAPRRYDAGTLLLEQGEPADHVYVVLDGAVRIYQRAADGREVLVKLMRAPCLFGDLELLAEVPMVKNVAAVEDVQLAIVPGSTFLELLFASKAATEGYLRQVASAFCVAARSQRQVLASVEQRVANLLLSYADFYGRAEGDDVLVEAKLSQQQIALSLGAARRSVAKVLGDWTNKGLVSRRGEQHLIHRVAELEALAEPIRGSLNFQIGMPLDQLARQDVLDQGVVEVEAHGQRHRLTIGDELLVGAHRGCHLVLQDAQVADRHCRIYRGATGPRFWIEDLQGAHGTRVNGAPIQRAVLRDGDTIEVGATPLRFVLERGH
ncbi:MAG: cyclic nucleotide-binding domain-containing protein [Myxococcales bacterium]|nr:cyclic nucleotide-binding domain-containing protein [Myxococcales bacterium]